MQTKTLSITPNPLYHSSPLHHFPQSSYFQSLIFIKPISPQLVSSSVLYLSSPPSTNTWRRRVSKMRAEGCTIEQALTPEAAAIVKQAVGLARRRGHAQVTPLHVANTMLSSPTGLLRSACLRSHSHPLQCKALELCFNVALNRLPAAASSSPSSGPMFLGPHRTHHQPSSLSNALVAAFKRAQAHQRRSSVDTQQQPLLAVKIEFEQLIVSILDDPSVSRVMREAGFCSTQVKSNVEKAVSLETCTSNPSKPKSKSQAQVRNEDVMCVVDTLVDRRKRSVVIVGESLRSSESVVRGLMDKVEKGEVPDDLRSLQFVSLPLISFHQMTREEVETKVEELRCLLRSSCHGRGVVLYLGDLKWASEYWASTCGERRISFYCPIENVIKEIGKLVCEGLGGENGCCREFWLMGIATYQTYISCRVGDSSLQTLLDLQPLAVPAGSLDLSLNYDSNSRKRSDYDRPCWSLLEVSVGNQFTCSSDQALGAANIASSCHASNTSSLPPWLQHYKQENRSASTYDLDTIQPKDRHQQHQSEKTLNFALASPASSCDQHFSGFRQTKLPWGEQRSLKSGIIEEDSEPNSRVSNSTSTSSDIMEVEYLQKFKELNAENLKILCDSLEKKVSWQKEIVPEIASAILQCRSGMIRRKERLKSAGTKVETWLFFSGSDVEGKEKIARELATLIFGSHTSFISIGLSDFSSTRSNSPDNLGNKRPRTETSHSYLEKLVEAIRDNPHRVILLEDIDQIDYCSKMGIKTAIETGKIRSSTGEEIGISDAIVILSCENFDSGSRACSPPTKQKLYSDVGKEEDREEISSCVVLDLNLSAEGGCDEECSFDDAKLLESVDRTFVFKLSDYL